MAIKLLCIGTVDAGRMLGINRSTVWRYVQQGLLQGISSGNYNLIPLHEVAHQSRITLAKAMQRTEQYFIQMYLVWMQMVDQSEIAMQLLCVSTVDAGIMLGITRTTVWRYVQQGLLQGISYGNYNLIPLHEVAHQSGITLTKAMQRTQQYSIQTFLVYMERAG